MWSWLPLVPGRIPRKARNTASGDPIQKKFSTWGEISSTLMRMEMMLPNTAGFDFSLHLISWFRRRDSKSRSARTGKNTIKPINEGGIALGCMLGCYTVGKPKIKLGIWTQRGPSALERLEQGEFGRYYGNIRSLISPGAAQNCHTSSFLSQPMVPVTSATMSQEQPTETLWCHPELLWPRSQVLLMP